jgi:hypothetical protein
MCAQVLVNGVKVASLQRNGDISVVLGAAADDVAKAAGDAGLVILDIIVEGVGRTNTGLLFDVKGLTSGLVLLNSARCQALHAFPSSCQSSHVKAACHARSPRASLCAHFPAPLSLEPYDGGQSCSWRMRELAFCMRRRAPDGLARLPAAADQPGVPAAAGRLFRRRQQDLCRGRARACARGCSQSRRHYSVLCGAAPA